MSKVRDLIITISEESLRKGVAFENQRSFPDVIRFWIEEYDEERVLVHANSSLTGYKTTTNLTVNDIKEIHEYMVYYMVQVTQTSEEELEGWHQFHYMLNGKPVEGFLSFRIP